MSRRDFRILPSGDGTGAEDYGATVEVRDSAGRWVDVVQGSTFGLPPLDGSGKYPNKVSVQLLDWQRATPVLEDLGPGSTVVGSQAGDVNLIQAGGENGCLAVWRFSATRITAASVPTTRSWPCHRTGGMRSPATCTGCI